MQWIIAKQFGGLYNIYSNMTVTLGRSNTDGNNIPILIYSTKSKTIRYM